jgi:hypothetical protein
MSASEGRSPDMGTAGRASLASSENGEKRTLKLADERYLRQESVEWGSDGGGPALLPQAILNDFLATEVDLLVARTVMREMVAARLPSEFELDGREIAGRPNDRLAAALRDEARASLSTLQPLAAILLQSGYSSKRL